MDFFDCLPDLRPLKSKSISLLTLMLCCTSGIGLMGLSRSQASERTCAATFEVARSFDSLAEPQRLALARKLRDWVKGAEAGPVNIESSDKQVLLQLMQLIAQEPPERRRDMSDESGQFKFHMNGRWEQLMLDLLKPSAETITRIHSFEKVDDIATYLNSLGWQVDVRKLNVTGPGLEGAQFIELNGAGVLRATFLVGDRLSIEERRRFTAFLSAKRTALSPPYDLEDQSWVHDSYHFVPHSAVPDFIVNAGKPFELIDRLKLFLPQMGGRESGESSYPGLTRRQVIELQHFTIGSATIVIENSLGRENDYQPSSAELKTLLAVLKARQGHAEIINPLHRSYIQAAR
jgi:hypothetical protein